VQAIRLNSRVGADGTLRLEVPVGLANAEVEVVIIIQARRPGPAESSPESRGWPPGFFEETAGCLRDDPIERAPQGEYEVRESLE
jgi:hypothetical protein